jgi:hypothetical protein
MSNQVVIPKVLRQMKKQIIADTVFTKFLHGHTINISSGIPISTADIGAKYKSPNTSQGLKIQSRAKIQTTPKKNLFICAPASCKPVFQTASQTPSQTSSQTSSQTASQVPINFDSWFGADGIAAAHQIENCDVDWLSGFYLVSHMIPVLCKNTTQKNISAVFIGATAPYLSGMRHFENSAMKLYKKSIKFHFDYMTKDFNPRPNKTCNRQTSDHNTSGHNVSGHKTSNHQEFKSPNSGFRNRACGNSYRYRGSNKNRTVWDNANKSIPTIGTNPADNEHKGVMQDGDFSNINNFRGLHLKLLRKNVQLLIVDVKPNAGILHLALAMIMTMKNDSIACLRVGNLSTELLANCYQHAHLWQSPFNNDTYFIGFNRKVGIKKKPIFNKLLKTYDSGMQTTHAAGGQSQAPAIGGSFGFYNDYMLSLL